MPTQTMKAGELYRYPDGRGWCRHGLLKVYQRPRDGTLYLCDTYWGSSDNDATRWNPEMLEGKITFVLDLSSAKMVRREIYDQYRKEDRAWIPSGGGPEQYWVSTSACPDPKLVEAQHLQFIANAEEKKRSAEHELAYRKREYAEWKADSSAIRKQTP